jgi:diguanylate cyclase (GGDEF)-like protein
MDSMKLYFPCQSVAVILIDDDTKELRIKISRQISYTFVKKFHKDGPSPTAEQVVLEQRPTLFNDVDKASDTYNELKLEHDFNSAVLVPVVKNQRGIGYIFCDRSQGKNFEDSDLLHLQVIGYLTGNLIEKFELVKSSKKLSSLDDSTQTLQYKAFVPALATELERAKTHDYQVTIAMLVVDAFRRYVDTYGIDDAHALLAETAGIIKNHIRDMDILARFGADEFILCLSGTTTEEAQSKLEAIRDDVTDKAVGHGDSSPVTITIGAISLSTQKAKKQSLQTILATLGKTMVQAKSKQQKDIVISAMD